MRWEFLVLTEGRHIFDSRKVSGTQGSNLLALVVQKMDSAIHRISRCLWDKYYENQLHNLVDRDLSSALRYPPFKQLATGHT